MLRNHIKPNPRVIALRFPELCEPMPVYIKLDAPAMSVWYAEKEGYTFDTAGRPYAAFVGRRRFRRALDGRIIETAWGEGKQRLRPRRVHFFDGDEATVLLQHWRSRIQPIAEAVLKSGFTVETSEHPYRENPDPEKLAAIFARIQSWDDTRLAADLASYHRVYRPVTILPPDHYLSLYLQMTLGCSYNRCVFCDFYRDRPFVVKDQAAFLQHIAEVKAYFGESLAMRRTIFLGDANALHIEPKELLRRFEAIHTHFPIRTRTSEQTGPGFASIYSFIDSFTGVRLDAWLLRELADAGLHRVYIGLETGNEALRRLLAKPGKTTQVLEVVAHLKAAGIGVGVIILVGVGGAPFNAAHIRDTVAALEKMALDRDDIIYLSDLVVAPQMAYSAIAANAGWDTFSSDALLNQRLAFIQQIQTSAKISRAKIANYDIREFVY